MAAEVTPFALQVVEAGQDVEGAFLQGVGAPVADAQGLDAIRGKPLAQVRVEAAAGGRVPTAPGAADEDGAQAALGGRVVTALDDAAAGDEAHREVTVALQAHFDPLYA
jgi:hypothetical protein